MIKLKYGYDNLSKEEVAELYEQMEDRVQLFMAECTGMSKTNYTLDVIKQLIEDKKNWNLTTLVFLR